MNPQNQKSLNLTMISWRNHQMNRCDFSEKIKIMKTEIKNKINSNYGLKIKSKAIQRKTIPNPQLRSN